jgi:hypothetical protein
MKKLFEVHQRLTAFGNEYRILGGDSENLQLEAYAKQKRLAMREKFTLFTGEDQKQVLATSQARKVFDPSTAHIIRDDKDKILAVVKKEFKSSLLRSTWTIYADEELTKPLFKVQESNSAVAILRRVWHLLPVTDFVPFLIKFHFDILVDNEVVGKHSKITLLRDHYAFYLDEEHAKVLDEKAWMIFAILLDAMQAR